MYLLQDLYEQILLKQSYLCVGLDSDLSKIPSHLLSQPDPLLVFNHKIIEATHSYAVAYKINTAFYEAFGMKGWDILSKTLAYIPKNILTIADAKRGDIGNTATQYAKAFFETLNFDAVTVSPYMGQDSIMPFLAYKNKATILLTLTSNKSNEDFEMLTLAKGGKLYEEVIKKSLTWQGHERLMYVVGATQPHVFEHIRNLIPKHFLLVPGVGAQGGNLDQVSTSLLNKENVGLLVNVARHIIYTSVSKNFEIEVEQTALNIQQDMKRYLQNQ